MTYRLSMAPVITIRAERPDDGPTITNIVEQAYADIPYSDHREHLMIDRLRDTDGYVPALSLLAEVQGQAVGHILLTKAKVRNAHSAVTVLALAPLSVVPGFQNQGIGKSLIGAAHDQATALGFGSVLVVGIPGYYQRYGYERLSLFPIRLPFEAPDKNCMIRQLLPGALDGVDGIVQYAEGWLDH